MHKSFTPSVCYHLQLCKYDTEGDPPDYSNIGEQKEVQCEISPDGKIALVYPVQYVNIALLSVHEC